MTEACAHEARALLTLYEGEFLAGFHIDGCSEFDEWKLLTGESLRRKLFEAISVLTDWHMNRRELTLALPFAELAVQIEPLSEKSQRQLIELLVDVGESAQALECYQRFRQNLLATLGIEPSRSTTDVARTIQQSLTGLTTLESPGTTATDFPAYIRDSH